MSKNEKKASTGPIRVIVSIAAVILIATIIFSDVKLFTIVFLVIILAAMALFMMKSSHGLDKDYEYKEYKHDDTSVDMSHIFDKIGEEKDPKKR